MRRVPMVDCPDGISRAQFAPFGYNQVGSTIPAGPVVAKTASYTILPSEIGGAFSAGAAITFTLPTPYAGAALWIFKTSNHTITVAAEANTTVNGAASLANSTAGDAGNGALLLIGTGPTTWFAFKLGTWA